MQHVQQPLAGGWTYLTGGVLNGTFGVGGTWTAYSTWVLPAFTLGGTVTSNGQSFSGTIANLGTVTTVDLNGGTIDGTTQATGTINGSIAVGGTWTSAAAWTIPAFSTGGQITSTVTTGTPPLVVASTTAVTNLNADLLDGQHGTYYQTALGYTPINKGGDTAIAGDLAWSSGLRTLSVASGSDLSSLTVAAYGSGTKYGSVYLSADGANAILGINNDVTVRQLRVTQSGGPQYVDGASTRSIWHDGNDGTGSGLDADLLDGQHGSYYRDASNLNAGTVPTARLGSGTANSAAFLRGDSTWSNALTGSLDLSGASAGQIVFPATQNASANANTLDDYQEETSWAPTITAQGGTFTTVSSTGWHTKVGNTVTFFLAITITNAGTATGGVLFPLPYTAATSWSGAGVMATTPFVSLYCVDAGGNNAVVNKYDATTPIATGAVLWVNGSFRV